MAGPWTAPSFFVGDTRSVARAETLFDDGLCMPEMHPSPDASDHNQWCRGCLGAEGDAAWPSTNRAARDSAPKPDGSIAPTLQLPPRWDDDGQPHLRSACQVFLDRASPDVD